MKRPELPDARVEPLTNVDRWVPFLPGMKRSAVYEAVKRGELPSIRVGRRIYVPTLQMLQRLGIASEDSSGAPSTDAPAANPNGIGGRPSEYPPAAA